MKAAVVALVLALALGLLYFAWNERPSPPRGPALPDAPPAAADEQPGREAPRLPEEHTQADQPEARQLVPSVEATREEPGDELCRGRVLFVDEDGIEQTDLAGSIELTAWKGIHGVYVEARIDAGLFQLPRGSAEHFTVRRVELEGRTALRDEPLLRYVPGSEPFVVRTHAPKTLFLSVLDQASGRPLEHLTLMADEPQSLLDDSGSGTGYPPSTRPEDALVLDGSSPLALRADSDARPGTATRRFVHSPGYAWGSILLDLEAGGERELRLGPGGTLEVWLAGTRPPHGASLRLLPFGDPMGDPFLERSLPADFDAAPLTFEGLPAGLYVASVKLGAWYDDPIVYAMGTAKVVAGLRSTCRLQLEAPAAVERAQLAGELFAPLAWQLKSPTISAEFRGTLPGGAERQLELSAAELTPLDGAGQLWGFDFGQVAVGAYTLTASDRIAGHELSRSTGATVTGEGVTDARIEFPAAGEVRVTLLDGSTGEPAKARSLQWSTPFAHPYWDSMSGAARRLPSEASFQFAAPIGDLDLQTYGGSPGDLHETVTVGPGLNDFTFELTRSARISFKLMDGETPVPLPEDWYPTAKRSDLGRIRQSYLRSNGNLTLILPGPGEYVLELPKLTGFTAIPDQTIEVIADRPMQLVIQLTRE